MRITPLDIRKQEFKKVVRGLDSEEVYAFLQTVAEEYELMLQDNKALRERLVELDDKVNEYRNMERTLRDTLVTAERVRGEAQENARREAEIIISQAQIDAEKASANVREQAKALRREIMELKNLKESYTMRLRALIDSQGKFLENFSGEFSDLDAVGGDELEGSPGGAAADVPRRDAPPVAPQRLTRDQITREIPKKGDEFPDERERDLGRAARSPGDGHTHNERTEDLGMVARGAPRKSMDPAPEDTGERLGGSSTEDLIARFTGSGEGPTAPDSGPQDTPASRGWDAAAPAWLEEPYDPSDTTEGDHRPAMDRSMEMTQEMPGRRKIHGSMSSPEPRGGEEAFDPDVTPVPRRRSELGLEVRDQGATREETASPVEEAAEKIAPRASAPAAPERDRPRRGPTGERPGQPEAPEYDELDIHGVPATKRNEAPQAPRRMPVRPFGTEMTPPGKPAAGGDSPKSREVSNSRAPGQARPASRLAPRGRGGGSETKSTRPSPLVDKPEPLDSSADELENALAGLGEADKTPGDSGPSGDKRSAGNSQKEKERSWVEKLKQDLSGRK